MSRISAIQLGAIKDKRVVYAVLLPSLLLILTITIGFEGTAGSARYLLSALGQSIAGIIALSFTIPLVALQLTASKYGIKAYELFLINIWQLLWFLEFLLQFFLFSFFQGWMNQIIYS
jgi:uncharacterized membrane protein